jgi:hypothetical protein
MTQEAATAAWLLDTLRARDPRRPGIPELEQRARDLNASESASASGVRGPQPTAASSAAAGPAAGESEEALAHLVRHLTLIMAAPANGDAGDALRAAALSGAASLLMGLGRCSPAKSTPRSVCQMVFLLPVLCCVTLPRTGVFGVHGRVWGAAPTSSLPVHVALLG